MKRIKRPKANRKHKDTVFVDLFGKDRSAEKNFRSLYSALHDMELDDHAQIKSVHIENVLYTNMVNDVSYILEDSIIFLAEHQSTINENMPLRCFSYLERLYGQLVKLEERYQKEAIELPTPEFYVFYNGKEDYPINKELKLSDAFKRKDEKIKLEIIVEVININLEKGNKILEKCTPLREYSQFIDSVRKHTAVNSGQGFEKAIEECISMGILSEYLERKSKEVRNMLTAEYDYEMDIAVQRKEAMQKGIAQGENKRNADIVLKMVSKGLDMKTISEYTDLDISEVKKIKDNSSCH